MATGDLASAAGLAVFPDTADVNTGADNDNVRGDELGDHMLNGGHPWGKISGKPSTFPPALNSVGTGQLESRAVTRDKIADQTITSDKIAADAVGPSELRPEAVGPGHVADDAIGNRHITAGAVDTPQIAPSAVVWSKLSSDVQDRIDGNTSSRRYKEDIQPAEVPLDAVLALAPVTFHHRSALPGVRELGLIAEEVHDAGVADLVVWRSGVVDGVRYDRLAVALLAVVKDQAAQLEQLRGDVAALTPDTTTPEEA